MFSIKHQSNLKRDKNVWTNAPQQEVDSGFERVQKNFTLALSLANRRVPHLLYKLQNIPPTAMLSFYNDVVYVRLRYDFEHVLTVRWGKVHVGMIEAIAWFMPTPLISHVC